MKLYVGSLAYNVVEKDLETLFAPHGQVVSVEIPRDDQGRMRGFGVVEMASDAEAEVAIQALNGVSLNDRKIVVAPPEPDVETPGFQLDATKSPLLRTDFSDDVAWRKFRLSVEDPTAEFHATVEFIEDRRFKDFTAEKIRDFFLAESRQAFVMVADRETLTGSEFPVLVIDLDLQPGRSFRAAAAALWSVENNLALGNMEFAEFADAAGSGVFAGFSE